MFIETVLFFTGETRFISNEQGRYANQNATVMRNLCALGISLLLFGAFSAGADDWPQWRGPQRNGISRETGLLKEWPKEGPKLRWRIADIGSGYSTPAVVGDRLYLLGNDSLENELLA